MSEVFEAKAKMRASPSALLAFAGSVVASVLIGQLGMPYLISRVQPEAMFWWVSLPFLVLLAPTFFWLRHQTASRPIRLDSKSLSLGRGAALPLTEIRSVDADLCSDGGVRLVQSNGRVTHIQFEYDGLANNFIERLRQANVPMGFRAEGIAPTGAVAALALGILATLMAVTMTLLVKFGVPGGAPMFFMMGFGGAVGSVSRALGPNLEIRSDGVRLSSPFRTRFIPFSEIVDITRTAGSERAISIVTRGGESAKAVFAPGNVGRILAVLHAAHQAFLTHAAVAVAPDLELGSHEVDAWKQFIAAPSAGYRELAYSNDQLATVVAHRSAPPTARVAAAVKLVSEGHGEAKAKIRIAAAETASPKLRIALEKAANGEVDAALDEAIEAERAT